MNTNTIHYPTQEERKGLLGVLANKRDESLELLTYFHSLRPSELSF